MIIHSTCQLILMDASRIIPCISSKYCLFVKAKDRPRVYSSDLKTDSLLAADMATFVNVRDNAWLEI